MYIYKVINAESMSDEAFSACLPYLSEGRRERVDRLKLLLPKKLSAAGDLLARGLAADFIGVSKDSLLIKSDERGKPYIEGCPVHISISHSGSYALAAASDMPIGADIERIRAVKKKVAAHVLSDGELEYVLHDESLYNKRIIKLWTMKEAYGKMTGHGVFKKERFTALIKDNELVLNYDTCCFSFPAAPEGYVICVCEKQP